MHPTIKDLIDFITSNPSNFRKFTRKVKAIEGDVSLLSNSDAMLVAKAIKEKYKGNTIQISYAKRLIYAFDRFSSIRYNGRGSTFMHDLIHTKKRLYLHSYS